jgi:hypothetical protein
LLPLFEIGNESGYCHNAVPRGPGGVEIGGENSSQSRILVARDQYSLPKVFKMAVRKRKIITARITAFTSLNS